MDTLPRAVRARALARRRGDAAKGARQPFVLYGTAVLCVVNAGLCLFGEVVKHRALADWTQAGGGRT